MIVNLLTLIGALISALPIEGPEFDPSFFTYLDQGWSYVVTAVDIFGVFIGPTGMRAIGLFLSFVIAINIFYLGWQLFLFVAKKIPFLNIQP